LAGLNPAASSYTIVRSAQPFLQFHLLTRRPLFIIKKGITNRGSA
jgi:hypothetical protein